MLISYFQLFKLFYINILFKYYKEINDCVGMGGRSFHYFCNLI